jgi:integrase
MPITKPMLARTACPLWVDAVEKVRGIATGHQYLAIDESKLKFNPFSKIVPKLDDEEERLPLSETDIKNIRSNFDRISEHDQLLFRILASTGMRLSEAFEIDGEFRERGCRYVIVGTKSPQSKRRVPLPTAVLPYVPRNIDGPLFQGSARAASKRLNLFLNEIGITDPLTGR